MDRLLEDLHIPYKLNVPLGPLTWYGVGGPVKILAHPSNAQQLGALAARAHELQIPTYVLGGGANLLVSEAGVDGLVVMLDGPGFQQVKTEGNIVTAGAGCDLFKIIPDISRQGLSGLEVLAGIPGTVGGAVKMNAGGTYGDIGKSVRRVMVMDASGQTYYRDRDDLVFGYRKTNIAARYILEAEFELEPRDPEEVVRMFKEVFFYKKNSQPLADHSAGCAFKNPPPDETGEKRSAGRLIDQAGLKGFRIGGAEVSSLHANFVVADRGTKASDIIAVMDHVRHVVLDKFGVALEREVVVWP